LAIKRKLISVFTIISQFRKELKLEGINEFAVNEIEAIESLLKIGFEYIGAFSEIRKYINRLRANITSSLKERLDEELFKEFRIGKIEGNCDWTSFEIWNEDSGILIYMISTAHPNFRRD